MPNVVFVAPYPAEATLRFALAAAAEPRGEGYEGEGWVLLRHPETEVVERALFRLIDTLRVDAEG